MSLEYIEIPVKTWMALRHATVTSFLCHWLLAFFCFPQWATSLMLVSTHGTKGGACRFGRCWAQHYSWFISYINLSRNTASCCVISDLFYDNFWICFLFISKLIMKESRHFQWIDKCSGHTRKKERRKISSNILRLLLPWIAKQNKRTAN